MAGTGKLKLNFLDVYRKPLKDKVNVSLRHRVLADSHNKPNRDASKILLITGLQSSDTGIYKVDVAPSKYRPISRFVIVREGRTTEEKFVLPVEPGKVVGLDAPPYDALAKELKDVLKVSEVEGFAGKRGQALYQALDDIRKAGLLNLYAKMKATVFSGKRDVFSYVSAFTRLRGDRLFARVQKDLRDETKNSIASGLFDEAPEHAHTPPPEYPLRAGSFKTGEKYGNLQLTFFSNPATLEFLIDADIDDAQGIGHLFQVLGHVLSGGQTHPYDIHEILLEHQRVDPGYRLVV